MLCDGCAYKDADCKGIKGSKTCGYYKKPKVFNAHEAMKRIAELEEENRRLKAMLKGDADDLS